MAEGEARLPAEALLGTALVFAPLAFGTTESWSRGVVFLLVAALCLVRLRALGLAAALPDRIPPLFWAMAALAVLAVVQTLNPVWPLSLALADGPFTVSRRETLDWLFDWSVYAGVLLFVPGMFRSTDSAQRLAWLLLASGALVAVVGIAQQQAGNTQYYGLRTVGAFRVPFGPFPNKNHAAAYLAVCALAGAGLAGALAERWTKLRAESKQDEFFGRLTVILALEFLLLAGLLKANSRGAVAACLGAGLPAAALFLLSKRRLGKAALWAAMAGGTAFLLAVVRFAGMDFASYLPNAGENSVTFRYAMATDGVKMIAEFPVFGLGLGALGAAYPLWMDPVMKGFFTDHLHCDPLELAAEAGIPLAAVFYAAYIATLAIPSGALSRGEAKAPAPLTLAMLAAPAAILLHQVLEFPSHIMAIQLTSLVCLAAAWGHGRLAGIPERPPTPPTGKQAAFWGAAAAALGLALCGPRMAAAYLDLLASRYPQPSKSYYEAQAAAWEPAFERRLGLARSNWTLAEANPPARTILLRKALEHSYAALELEPLHPNARNAQAAVLAGLGRRADAREYRVPR